MGKLRATLAVSVASAAVAGCGGYGAPSGGGAPPGTPATGKQAVAQCEQSIQTAPQLSKRVKRDLESICRKAASGDEKAVRKATQEVCETIIDETVPGPGRSQAKASCRQGP